jgi:methylenetetrahydrofolate reductase (NADPH)
VVGPAAPPLTSHAPAFRVTLSAPAGEAIVVELVPWAGSLRHGDAGRHLETARALTADDRVTALTVTDNAGGHVRLGPHTLGREIRDLGADVLVHVSCRDRSRGALNSLAWDLASSGLTNILALTGDYPVEGYQGLSRPVFDIDAVGLLAMLRDLPPEGPILAGEGLGHPLDAPHTFFAGGVVNPFKSVERDLLPQLLKLEMKVRAGARFAITQLGWDTRSWDELLRWTRRQRFGIPILAAVYILGRTVARAFHAGRIPGCYLSDELLALVERDAASPDKGRSRFLELAAMQVAVARGLGFRGIYLAGQRNADEVGRVLGMASSFGADDWRSFTTAVSFPVPGAFRLFEPAADQHLATDTLSAAWVRSRSDRARRGTKRRLPFGYRAMRLMHDRVFTPGTSGFALGARVSERAEEWHLKRPLHVMEQAVKVPLFECRDCGDCSLPEIAYLCPESQCVKNQRNGPCGGSRAGDCEVPGKPCIWALAYDRLKPYGEELRMLDRPPTIQDNALRGSSAWANTFLGRDHAGKRRP